MIGYRPRPPINRYWFPKIPTDLQLFSEHIKVMSLRLEPRFLLCPQRIKRISLMLCKLHFTPLCQVGSGRPNSWACFCVRQADILNILTVLQQLTTAM